MCWINGENAGFMAIYARIHGWEALVAAVDLSSNTVKLYCA